jgi:hypothetical protein
MSGQILTKEIATQWAMNWDPECPSDVLYPDIDACTSISDEAAAVFAEFEFKCAVNAAIRYKLADAMLKVRSKP